ncbi:hypothetical protein SAMN05216548_10160 [Faunimonas pinastri]|uniref:Uncharacterized protein n=1 Tax=Faunimonas pinastri TaxID=1855383 RepID=A0A1H8Z6Y6_9HYPH|nr:hypothetical protein [Faunimonas pinastri]SEP60200.1 hypothetical protein SAMN05216548_10160 [Faunimonas pinastri]
MFPSLEKLTAATLTVATFVVFTTAFAGVRAPEWKPRIVAAEPQQAPVLPATPLR